MTRLPWQHDRPWNQVVRAFGIPALLLPGALAACSVAAGHESTAVTIVGRTVDGAGRPCEGARVQLKVYSDDCSGTTCQSDGEGRFTFVTHGSEVVKHIRIDLPDDALDVPQHHADIAVQAGYTYDLGDLVLDGRNFLTRLDDDTAERLLREWVEQDTNCEWFEPLLIELSRRPKARWIPVVERQLALASDSVALSLPLLTTLRRLQGRPDPVRVERVGMDPIVVEWPGDTFIKARAVNDDAEGAKFAVSSAGIEQWFVQILDAGGNRVPAVSRFFLGEVMATQVVLSRQDAVDGGGNLEHADALAPGQYRVRVLYHGSDALGWPWRRDWLVISASDEIPLKVVPRRIRTDRNEQAKLAAAFAGTLIEAPSALDEASFQAWLFAVREAQDVLTEAGWRSVPMLIEVLEDEHAATDARARAFDQLTSITGARASGLWLPTGSVSADQVEQWRAWRGNLEIEVR